MALPRDSILYVTVFAAVGSGLMGGLLFAFSNFVMKALVEQPPASAIRTMQAINVTIVNPLFLAIFLGTALATAILAVTALLRLSTPGMPLLLVGAALFLLGAFGVTLIFNVPLNNALATQDPGTAAAAQFWLSYVSRWMVWNHVRTIASLAATVCLILAIHQDRSPLN
jgi:uncharacterized membrane protein